MWRSAQPLSCQLSNGKKGFISFYVVNIPINIWGRDLIFFRNNAHHLVGKLAATAQIPRALPLKWLTDVPKWVEQWPLPKVKLEALEQLVEEQLQSGHIKPSTSPWNSPVLSLRKNLVNGEC